MKHWGKKLFLFKGLVSSPIRLSFATSIISRRLTLAVPEPRAHRHQSIHPPTLLSSLWTHPARKLGDGSAAVITGEIKIKGGGIKPSKEAMRTSRANNAPDTNGSCIDSISFATSKQHGVMLLMTKHTAYC